MTTTSAPTEKAQDEILTPTLTHVYTYNVKTVNALAVRQSLGKVLRELARTREPILVEKDRKPAAVLISVQDFRERFTDKTAAEERRKIVEEIRAIGRANLAKGASSMSNVDLIREMRGPLPRVNKRI